MLLIVSSHAATTNTSSCGLGVVFQHPVRNGKEERYPTTQPIQGTDGNFYGTVRGFGTFSCGLVYKMTPSGTLTLLYEFDNYHGCAPLAPLVEGSDGNFYGTTASGGTTAGGVIYKITPTGNLTVLYNLNQSSGQAGTSPLIQANDGNFYGATITGGGIESGGAIFRITPTGNLKVLHDFSDSEGGGYVTGLIQASDGNFYGATGPLGASAGTIFKITPTGSFSVLYSFDNNTAQFPLGTLFQSTNGTLYGMTNIGGTGGGGVFYSFNVGLGPFVSFVLGSGKVGQTIEILGKGFTGTTKVSFNGVPATSFAVMADTYLRVMVPQRATTGFVTVTTPGGISLIDWLTIQSL